MYGVLLSRERVVALAQPRWLVLLVLAHHGA